MSAPDPFALLVAPLNASGVSYMVTGAHAAAMFGEPRFTNDLDVVMRIGRGEARRLHAVFPEPDYYIAPVETIEEEAARPRHGSPTRFPKKARYWRGRTRALRHR